MDEAPLIRKKAWERAFERGLIARVARAVGVRPQTARRWFLAPEHADHRAVRGDRVARILARHFDLQPNDFIWLYGEKAARRRARDVDQKAAA